MNRNAKSTDQCFICHEYGHWAFKCPIISKEGKVSKDLKFEEDGNDTENSAKKQASSSIDGSRPELTGNLPKENDNTEEEAN